MKTLEKNEKQQIYQQMKNKHNSISERKKRMTKKEISII